MTARQQEIDGLRACARTMRDEGRKILDLDPQSAIGRALDAYAGLYDLKVQALSREHVSTPCDASGNKVPFADRTLTLRDGKLHEER